MRKNLLTFFICGILGMIACMPVSASESREEKIDRLLQESGIAEQIMQFPKAMKFSISQIHDMGQCDENSYIIINNAIDDTIITTTMTTIVKTDLLNSMSESDMDSLLEWYDSDLGSKIADLEHKASKPEAYKAMLKNQGKLFSNQKKLADAKKIDQILHATDWAVKVQMQSTIAMLGGLAQIQHKDITQNLIQLATQLDKQLLLLKPQVEKSITLWYLYTYKDLKAEEMQQFTAFLASSKYQKFNDASLHYLAHAITNVVENFIIDVEKQSYKDIE